jgi:phosphoribosylaminoimidazolecarboxamide formyltransferase/IMP cyclohydrolase
MSDDLIPVRRALLSVSDKTGLKEFATALAKEFNVELISTGGTAKFLRDAGLKVKDVSEVTGFPEMMDGRVKTLHPKIHGGLLALRDNPQHVEAMKSQGIEPIDIVCVNLYPFRQTVDKPDVTLEEAIENIDIGGPSMIRSAAKNFHYVVTVTDPKQYEKVLGDLRKHNGSTCAKHRLKLAERAFYATSDYDIWIALYLLKQVRAKDAPSTVAQPDEMPITIFPHLKRKQILRYGENPHQKAALYTDNRKSNDNRKSEEASVAHATQLHGKELSYINLLDADAALAAVKEFTDPAACIVKHATPCGCAAADNLPDAFRRAFEGDPLAAFGGIVALNRPIDRDTAIAITSIDKLLEVIVAPGYAGDALARLKDRWKNVRLLQIGPLGVIDRSDLHMHKIAGGFLVQERDLAGVDEVTWKTVSRRQPTPAELADLKFAWLVCKHVKSNAIVICKDRMLLGAGAGQMDRPSAARLAIEKAGTRAKGAVAASDAFFPFPDGPQLLLDAGITTIVHPGGSLKDQDTINLVDERGAAMVLTGQRHFKH